jgi:hypothetical protein
VKTEQQMGKTKQKSNKIFFLGQRTASEKRTKNRENRTKKTI